MVTPPESPKANAPSSLAMEEPTEVPVEPAPADEPPPVLPQPAAAAGVREQDRLMPIANVVRIMRRVLPPNAKISDDAKEMIQECVSEFISFVTGEANDRCHSEHRKTVTADDIVWAMERLGFDNYAAPVETFVQRMRDWERTVRASGSRAKQNRAPNGPAPPAPMVALPGMQFQETPLPHGYGVPPQVRFNTDPQFGDQHNMFVGEPSVGAASYGEPALVTTGAGETSSANEGPAAAATTPPPQYPN